MRRLIVKRAFTEWVPGKGMVVANVAKDEDKNPITEGEKANIVSLPATQAATRVARGFAEYADERGDNEGDVPLSRKAKRLMAREQRKAERAVRAKAASEDDGSDEPLPEVTDENVGEVKEAPARKTRRAKPDTDAPVE